MRDLTLVFDLDGTLVDTAPDLVAATNHALADLDLPPVPAAILRPFIGFGARNMIVGGLRQSGIVLTDAEVERLLERFLAFYDDNIAVASSPYPGVLDALTRFRTHGARLAVCTNKREGLSRKLLDALDMSRLLPALAGRDTFTVCKPHPDHLLGAIAMAGGDRSRAVMIGDTTVDVSTARAAGVPVIACSFGYSDVPAHTLEADEVIGHFGELERAIAGLVTEFEAPSRN